MIYWIFAALHSILLWVIVMSRIRTAEVRENFFIFQNNIVGAFNYSGVLSPLLRSMAILYMYIARRVWNFKYSFSHVLLSETEALTKYTIRDFLFVHLSYNRSNWRTRFSISLHSMCMVQKSEISQKRSRI